MIALFKKRDYFGLAIFFAALGMLVWYLVAKINIFDKLGYQSDLYTHLEICRGWLQGRPIMHENCYGYHSQFHNYFFDLLMGPAVVPWGVYGMFGVQFAFYVFALLYTFPVVYKGKDTLNHKLLTGVFYIVIFCGPIGFWLLDNPHYGFHTEMMYVPLGFVFAISLYKKQHWVSALFAVLMVLVKEDGAVLVACIHLLYIALQFTAGKTTQKRWLYQSLLWGGVWLLVFVVGLLYLKTQSEPGKDRLSIALAHYAGFTTAEKTAYFVEIFKTFAWLLLPFAVFLVLIKQINYKAWWWCVVFLVPVTVVNLISGFVYFPAVSFSLTWVPRFSLTFSLLLAMGAYSLLLFSRPWFRPPFIIILAAVGISWWLFSWQKDILKQAKGYSYHYSTQQIFKEVAPNTYYLWWDDALKVSKTLPKMYPVAVPHRLFGYFHQQDIIWTERIPAAWTPPRMIICDDTNINEAVPNEVLQHPDSLISKNGMRFYFEREDRHYIEEAGVVPKK